jgi:hypothetical protein
MALFAQLMEAVLRGMLLRCRLRASWGSRLPGCSLFRLRAWPCNCLCGRTRRPTGCHAIPSTASSPTAGVFSAGGSGALRWIPVPYGVDQGLPGPVVNTFVETPAGLLVAGTDAGIAVLKPRVDDHAHNRFEVYYPGSRRFDREIQSLFVDRSGVLWCGTSTGLFRVRWTGSTPQFEAVVLEAWVAGLAQDQAGNLWAADFTRGVIKLTPGAISGGTASERDCRATWRFPPWPWTGRVRSGPARTAGVDGKPGLCKLRRSVGGDFSRFLPLARRTVRTV